MKMRFSRFFNFFLNIYYISASKQFNSVQQPT